MYYKFIPFPCVLGMSKSKVNIEKWGAPPPLWLILRLCWRSDVMYYLYICIICLDEQKLRQLQEEQLRKRQQTPTELKQHEQQQQNEEQQRKHLQKNQ